MSSNMEHAPGSMGPPVLPPLSTSCNFALTSSASHKPVFHKASFERSLAPYSPGEGLAPWLPVNDRVNYIANTLDDFDGRVNGRSHSTSRPSQYGGTEHWLNSKDAPPAFVALDPRPAHEQPRRPPGGISFNQLDSDATSMSDGTLYSGYSFRTATPPSIYQGNPEKMRKHYVPAAFCPSPRSVYSPTPSEAGFAHPLYVNPTVVNTQSAAEAQESLRCADNGFQYDPLYQRPDIYNSIKPPVSVSFKMNVSPPSDSDDRVPRSIARSGRLPHSPARSPARCSRTEPYNVCSSARRCVPQESTRALSATGRRSKTQRPFNCVFYFAGCTQTFATKNEWKRHVSSQHMQNKIWRCDYASCQDRKAATFNRKDLFGQHIRRMHAPAPAGATKNRNQKGPTTKQQTPAMTAFLNSDLPKIQERCCLIQRELPNQSTCGFCFKNFHGPGSWEDRMEHVGRHYETAVANNENVSPENWAPDQYLIDWAIRERLVTTNHDDSYSLVSVGKDAVVEAGRISAGGKGFLVHGQQRD